MKVRINVRATGAGDEDVWIIADVTCIEDDPYRGCTWVYSKDLGAIAFPNHLYGVEEVKEDEK